MKPEFTVGSPMPASIGLCADLFAEVREIRLAMQKCVDEVEAREKEIKEFIIDTLPKSQNTGASGKRYRAQIVPKIVPQLKDWPAFTAFVASSGRWDLIHKRVADRAVSDLWEDGVTVPGVEKFNSLTVSITKIQT